MRVLKYVKSHIRDYILRLLLSVIFATMGLWGWQINGIDSVKLFAFPGLFFILTVASFLFITLTEWIISLIENHMNVEYGTRFLIASGVIILAVWVLVWLSLWPGLGIYDGPSQLAQYKKGTISTHHPYIHTLFLALCDYLARITGFEDYTFFNALIQVIFQFVCYMRLLFVMKELRCRFAYMVVTVLFMAFYPANVFIALTTTKDTIFIGFFLLLMCELALLVRNKGEIEGSAWMRIFFFAAMMSIFRKNGIYAFAVGFPFILTVGWKKVIKQTIAVYILVFGFSMLYDGFVANVCHIPDGDFREALSAYIQPISRVYNSVPGELSDEELDRIHKLFGGEESIDYVSYCSDYSKIDFDTKFFRSEMGENLKLYWELFKRYPTAYVDALLATNLGNYYPLESLPRKLKVYYEIPLEDGGHSLIPGMYSVIADFAWNSEPYKDNPILVALLNSGTTLWRFLFMIYFIVKRRDYRKLSICALPFMLMGTMLMAAGTVIRYTQPITICIPLIFALATAREDDIIS